LQASGAISLSDLQTEYGGSNPISIDEYYLDGSYVPSSVTRTIPDASSLSQAGTIYNHRNIDIYPRINDGSNFFYTSMWTDDGNQHQDFIASCILQPGDYVVTLSGQSNGSNQRRCTVSGYSITETTLNADGSTPSDSMSFTLTQAARVYFEIYLQEIANWNQIIVSCNGASGGLTDTVALNENVPTSGVVSFDNFYNGQKNYE